jgi:hypothetical protein
MDYRMAALYARTQQALEVADQRQKQIADLHQREVEYKLGDKVLLSTENINVHIPGGGTKTLMPGFIGPFEVKRRLGSVAYRLPLPLNHSIHPGFHASLLHTYKSDITCQPPLPPESFQSDGAEYWIVDKIVKSRVAACQWTA